MILFARIISWLSSPPIILLPAPFLLVDKVTQNDIYALKWAAVSYVFIGVVTLFVLAGVLLGVFPDIDVSGKKQRPVVFLFSFIMLFLYALSVLVLKGPKVLLIASLGIAFGLVVLSIVNNWIKASVHVATISAFIFLTGIIYGSFYLLLAILLIPLIAWSRVKIKKHTIPEVIMGGFLGATLTTIFYIVAKQFLR